MIRKQVSSYLKDIDKYVTSLLSRGIEKKNDFINEINEIRSRPANSSLAKFEEDLRTCRDHEEQARNVSNLSTTPLERLIDPLESGTMSSLRFANLIDDEKRRLNKQYNQFSLSGYIDREKLRVDKELNRRKIVKVDKVRIEIFCLLDKIDHHIKNLPKGIIKKDEFKNEIRTVRQRQQNITLEQLELDLKTCIQHEVQARNVSNLNIAAQFDDYINQLLNDRISDARFTEMMELERMSLSSKYSHFEFEEFIELEKLRIVRKVEALNSQPR
jgi:hypothetical protein